MDLNIPNNDMTLDVDLIVEEGAGTRNYNKLTNKPSINGVELVGDVEIHIPTNVSELVNDEGYLTEETDPTVPEWAKQPQKPTYTASEVGALPDTTAIPSKTSELTNDSGFITEADVPTKTSELTNDSGFITDASIPTDVSAFNNDAGYLTSETDPTVPSWAKQPQKPTYTASEVGALPDTTVVPTKTSELTNDSNFISSESDPTVPSWAKQPQKPTYTASEVGALPDTTVVPTKTSELTNDSNFITSETDPTVPSWAKQPQKPTYTASEVGALPDTTAIPTKVSQLQNDSNFISTETDPTVPSWAKQPQKPTYTASEVGALPDTTEIPEVKANPTESATETLTKLGINGTVFNIEGGGTGASNLSDMNDVHFNAIADGEVVTYDSVLGKWINKESTGGTTVIANPTVAEDAQSLSSIQIGDDKFKIEGGATSKNDIYIGPDEPTDPSILFWKYSLKAFADFDIFNHITPGIHGDGIFYVTKGNSQPTSISDYYQLSAENPNVRNMFVLYEDHIRIDDYYWKYMIFKKAFKVETYMKLHVIIEVPSGNKGNYNISYIFLTDDFIKGHSASHKQRLFITDYDAQIYTAEKKEYIIDIDPNVGYDNGEFYVGIYNCDCVVNVYSIWLSAD